MFMSHLFKCIFSRTHRHAFPVLRDVHHVAQHRPCSTPGGSECSYFCLMLQPLTSSCCRAAPPLLSSSLFFFLPLSILPQQQPHPGGSALHSLPATLRTQSVLSVDALPHIFKLRLLVYLFVCFNISSAVQIHTTMHLLFPCALPMMLLRFSVSS